ncbi:hypothetical protein SCANM63S_06285 [Streptomyces canarius]
MSITVIEALSAATSPASLSSMSWSHLDGWVTHGSAAASRKMAGLDQGDGASRVGGEAVGEYAAGQACAHDDVVVPKSVPVGHVSPRRRWVQEARKPPSIPTTWPLT